MAYPLNGLKTVKILEKPSIEEWQRKRLSIENRWKSILKETLVPHPPEYKILQEEMEDGYTRKEIQYTTPDGDLVPALLLLPAHAGKKLPGVIAMHPTDAAGKKDIAHPSGRKERSYGIELAKRGYAVLAPDTITAGDRVKQGMKAFDTKSFYEQHPDRTAVGKMMADHHQAVSVLASIEETDEERIGAIGHSLGGYNAYFLGTLDNRIKAIVCSCGFSVFSGDPEKHRWGKREWFSHFPEMSTWIERGEIPFDFHEIASLCAPIPLFIWLAGNDRIFPNWRESLDGIAEIEKVYEVMGEGRNFKWLSGTGGHDFPRFIREQAYIFLDSHLKKSAN